MQNSRFNRTVEYIPSTTEAARRLKPLSLPTLNLPGTTEKVISTQHFNLKLACQGDRCQTGVLLVRHAYVWGSSSITNFDRRANKITLSIFFGDTAIGTLTLRLDSPGGLDADHLYRREMDLLRHRGHKICELTQMALDYNIRSKRVLASLFHIAFLYASRIRGCTDILLEATPRHASFYQNKFGFSLFGKEKSCSQSDATAMLLRLPSDYVTDKLDEGNAKGAEADSQQLYPYFFKKASEAELLRKLRENPGGLGMGQK